MNVERDDLEDYIKDLEEKIEKIKDMKKLRDSLIEGIRTILDDNSDLSTNIHEDNKKDFFTFDVKTNDFELEIKITGEIK